MTTCHATPAMDEAIEPNTPPRSSSERRMRDTVAETSAQGMIWGRCLAAPASALPMVGSPPVSRSFAAWTRAVLKKIVMKLRIAYRIRLTR